MASANTSVKDSFLSQLESVRVELKEKVSRAHQVLQERETALLSELQQLEENYKGEKVNEQIDPLRIIKEQNITALKDNENKEIHKRNMALLDSARDMRRVELEWDQNLEGILGKIGSIRVRAVPNFKWEKYPVILHNISIMDTSSTPADLFLLSIVIEPYISNTYYFDGRNSQVIFYTFTDEMKIPRVNFINLNKVYVTQDIANSLIGYLLRCRYIKSVGREDEKQLGLFCVSEAKPKVKSIANNHENLHPSENRPQQAVNSEDRPIRGLKNLGNTCFMNSVLQCLSHTLPLRQFYVSDEYKQYLNNRGDLSNAFKRVMANMWGTILDYYIAPYELKRQVGIVAPRFTGYSQHYAHEFMRFLLNELHEEINRASVEGRKSPADDETLEEACARYLTWEDSRISELFGGMLRSDVCCSVCSNQSTVYIPFLDIALPIPGREQRPYFLQYLFYDPAVHLTKCLKMLTTKETLDEEERPYCNKCMKLTKSTKQLSMNILPRFLVIQLKRFSYYPEPTKLSTPVKFDETWKVPDSAKKTHTYSLYGIVCHSGGIHGGHYIAYCKYSGIWRCFNDTMTRSVRWEHVKDQEAYILFYEKKDML